jgi:hypothetical protein
LKRLILLFYCSSLVYISNAQNGISQIGARPAGMAYTYATVADQWSIFNNPGGLGGLNETSAMAAFENKFGIEGFNSVGAAFLTTLPIGTMGVSAFRFGDDLYNEQTISLAYGNKFGIAGLGFKINYLQYTLQEFGSKGVMTIDFGGNAEISKYIRFGAYIRNINQAQVAEFNDERAPTTLNAGIAFLPSKKVTIAIEGEKDIDYDALFRAGLEYMFLKKFVVRTGIKTHSFTNYFGFGFVSQKLNIDYALTHDRVLGLSHQAALSYSLKKD